MEVREDNFFVLGKHKPPSTQERHEQIRGSITLEERAPVPVVEQVSVSPVVESQLQSQGGVGCRGTKRSMKEHIGKIGPLGRGTQVL